MSSLVPVTRDDLRAAVRSHRKLTRLLQIAYSAERAAGFAYIGHAGSVKDATEKAAIKEIERDEWGHRDSVLSIMETYDVPVSRWLEIRFYVIGKLISLSCYVIGWFMPYYFAGRLESGNVCEYFIMMQYFHELGITDHDTVLYEMGLTEKEHEVFFLDGLEHKRILPWFQRVFGWGAGNSYNDVNLDEARALAGPDAGGAVQPYCKRPSAPVGAESTVSRRLRRIQPW